MQSGIDSEGCGDHSQTRGKASAADREAAKDAAIDAATLAWWKQQAALAAELSITFDDWQRIVKLLSNPPPMRAKAVAKKKKDAEDSSDEDSSDGEDDDDESDCEGEDAFEVKAIHGKKGKGKTLQYLVEWEGYTERTWEPAAYLDNNVVLAEWLEASS